MLIKSAGGQLHNLAHITHIEIHEDSSQADSWQVLAHREGSSSAVILCTAKSQEGAEKILDRILKNREPSLDLAASVGRWDDK
jgi:hypothetical protein